MIRQLSINCIILRLQQIMYTNHIIQFQTLKEKMEIGMAASNGITILAKDAEIRYLFFYQRIREGYDL